MEQRDESLTGRHVIVVGGSSGMGLALARRAAAAGARLTLMARDPAKLEAAAKEVGGAQVRSLDLSREESVAAAVKGVEPADHLVITAGGHGRATIAESGPAEWRRVLEERLIGPISLVKAFAPTLTTSIVLFSGTASRKLLAGSVWPAIALSGLETATRALAVELSPLRVNAVVPGAVDTPLLADVLGERKEEATAAMRARLPAKRIGAPEDIAQATMFLMTNPFVTGETLVLDGGAVLL